MKSLAKNSAYNIIYKCLNSVFPLISTAYVSRILLAEGIGKVESAQNIVAYFTILAAMGLPTYGTKMIAAARERKQQSIVYSELFVLNAISTIVCLLLFFALVVIIPFFRERCVLLLVTGLTIAFNLLNVEWFYQGKEEYGYIMVRSLVVKAISLVSVFIFVKEVNDYIIYAVILALSKVANYLSNIVHIRKYVRFTFKGLHIRRHVKPVFLLLAASIAIEVYTLADVTMLAFIHGDIIVGYYSQAIKSISVIKMMLVAFCAVFLPRLSYFYAVKQKDSFENLVNKGLNILVFLTIPAALGIFLVANDMVPVLFGAGFEKSITTTRILAVSIITVAFSNFMGYQVLVTLGKEKIMLWSTVVGAVVNVSLNLVLIFYLKHNGVAIASVFTEFCVTVFQFYFARKDVKISINKKFLGSVVLSAVSMVPVVILCKYAIDNMYIRLIASVVFGAGTYVVISWLFKNELTIDINEIIKNKLKL